MLDGPQGRAVSKTAVNNCIDGEEVSHCGRVELSVLGEKERRWAGWRARQQAWGNDRDMPQTAFPYQANEIGQLGKMQDSLGKYLAHIPNQFKLGS